MSFEDEMDDWRDERTTRRPQHRKEELYVSEEYKIFMVAGTIDSFTRDPNHISVRPFRSLPAGKLDALRAIAKPWTTEMQSACDIEIRATESHLELKDGYSGVTSKFPVSELDDDVREDILYKIRARIFGIGDRHETIDPWKKYFDEADAADVQTDVASSSDVPVKKPLTFKKSGGGLNL
jgi:hypothetical protein